MTQDIFYSYIQRGEPAICEKQFFRKTKKKHSLSTDQYKVRAKRSGELEVLHTMKS